MKGPFKHGRPTSNNVKSFGILREEGDVSQMQPRTSGLPYMIETPTKAIKRLKRTYFSPHVKNS